MIKLAREQGGEIENDPVIREQLEAEMIEIEISIDTIEDEKAGLVQLLYKKYQDFENASSFGEQKAAIAAELGVLEERIGKMTEQGLNLKTRHEWLMKELGIESEDRDLR